MNTFFSLLFVIAYFGVFIFGLFSCYCLAHHYFKSREFIKSASTGALALFAIGGLIQAMMGV